MPFSKDQRTDCSRAEILARCVDAINAGKATIETCVAQYPEFETLGDLLGASQAVHRLPLVTLRADAKNDIRERMLAKYRVSQIQARPIRKSVPIRLWQRAAVSVAALLVILFGGGTALVGASDSALPGDVLYGVKRRIEQIELAFAASQEWPDLLYRNAQLRLSEIDTLTAHRQPLSNEVVNDMTQSVTTAIAFQSDQIKKTQLLNKTQEILNRAESQALLDPAAKESALKLLPEPSATITATMTATIAPTSTLVPTISMPSATATASPSATPTLTATVTATWTASPTASHTHTATLTPSATASPSPTSTFSPTPTVTPSATETSTVEPTEDPTKLGTATATRPPQQRSTATRTIRQRTNVPGGSGQRPTQRPRATQQQPTQANPDPGQGNGGNPQGNGGNNGNNGNNGGNGGNGGGGGGNGNGGGGGGNGGGNGN